MPRTTAVVRYADREPRGIAELVGRLLEGNLAAHPERISLLRSSMVEIRSTDAGVGVVLELSSGGILVREGTDARRDVLIAASSADLLEVAAAPLLRGLPDPRRRDGRAVLGAIAARRIRISGLVRHLGTVRRFARLLSVTEG